MDSNPDQQNQPSNEPADSPVSEQPTTPAPEQSAGPEPMPMPTSAPMSQPAAAPVAQPGQSKGFAIAALVLGIVAFLFGWLGAFNLLTAVLAVIFGIVALNKHQSKGMAIAGLVLGGIGLLTSLLFAFIFGVAFLQGVSDAAKESNNSSLESTPGQTSGWDYEAAYAKLKDGMTKAQAEAALDKESTSCSESESELIGHFETCTYGAYTDPVTVTVSYTDGKLSNKSKYKN